MDPKNAATTNANAKKSSENEKWSTVKTKV
jgi:hypothetical protein